MPLIRFESKPYAINSWVILRVPAAASAHLPSRGQVMVKGTVNGVQFQTALEPDGNGSHWLHVGAALQKAAKVRLGFPASLAVETTKDWPELRIPADVQKALQADSAALARWQKVTPMARWEWLRWIGSTLQAETRQRRIAVARSKLKAGMRRPCCFNRNMCCVPQVSKNGVLLDN